MRIALRIFGFASLVVAGMLVASPLLAALIPHCPDPPQYLYVLGTGLGLVAVFTFAAVGWLYGDG